jgi:thiosulfate dehydrogenase [quinone] large subunit
MISQTKKFSTDNLKSAPFIDFLFSSPKMAWLWLVVRVWLGYQWVTSGYGKLTNPAWMEGGAALKGFLGNSIQGSLAAESHPIIAYKWFLSFLQGIVDSGAYTWMAKLVSIGEFLIGIALILGLFTAVAAFFSGFMVWNFALAGSAGVAPMFLILSVFLVAAWRIAGLWGLDRLRFEYIGTLWQPGTWFTKSKDKQLRQN